VGLACGFALMVLFGWLVARASGIRVRRRIQTVRRHLTQAGTEPRHLLAVRPGDGPIRPIGLAAASPQGMLFLVHEELAPRSQTLELWRWSRGSITRHLSIDVARLTRVDVSPGNESGWWTDWPATIRLWFKDDDPALTLWVPGNQPGTMEVPWQLDRDARRRRQAAKSRMIRREATNNAKEAAPRPGAEPRHSSTEDQEHQ
jgi:hypothetical protein